MKVLAIDPGYGRCGAAVVERISGKDTLLYSDCIETSAQDDFNDRLAAVAEAVRRLIETYAPDQIAMEKLYFSTNQKTAMHVAEVRGALLQTATFSDTPVFEYTPAQIKSAVAGSGRADKVAVARMLHILLSIDKKIKYDDEYDAIAVGITHLAYCKAR